MMLQRICLIESSILAGTPCRILEEEDNLIAAHRWQIEETMAIVRQEMTLLGQVWFVTICTFLLQSTKKTQGGLQHAHA